MPNTAPIRRLVLALAIAMMAFPGAAAALPSDFIGMTAEDVFAGDASYRATTLSTQRTLGIGTIRQTFDWASIERAPGQFDLATYDSYVAALAAQGVSVLPILFNTPRFHLGQTAGRAACQPASLDTFARFAQVLVARYGPNGSLWAERPSLPKLPIRAWQIWNEPNLNIYWCGRASARQYVRMLRTVGAAIEQVDPGAEIVTAGIPPSKMSSAVRIERFIAQMYRARGRTAFDTLAINSYAKNRRELATLLRTIRRIMNRRRDRKARIWITELGWGDAGPAHRFIVGAEGQASRIRSSFSTIKRLRRKVRLRGVVYYTWRDAPPYPPEFKDMWGLHTGLLYANHQPKPAFWAFRDAAASLR